MDQKCEKRFFDQSQTDNSKLKLFHYLFTLQLLAVLSAHSFLLLYNIEESVMRKPCILKQGEGRLKIDQHKTILPKVKQCSSITFKNILEERTHLKIDDQELQKRNLELENDTKNIVFQNHTNTEQDQKVKKGRNTSVPKLLKNNGKNIQISGPPIRMKKSFSTSKNMENNYMRLSDQLPLKKQKCQDGIYSDKRKTIINYLRNHSIIIRLNTITNTISNTNLNKLINSLIFYQENVYRPGLQFDLFVKEQTFIESFKEFIQDDKENAEKRKFVSSFSQFKLPERNTHVKEKQQIFSLNQHLEGLKTVENNIKLSIQILQSKLKKIEKQFAIISNFSTNTSTILISVFGQEYTAAEEELQELARQLQSKHTEIEIKKEISPFIDIQIEMIDKLTSISKIINHDEKLSSKQKLDLIRNYMSKTISIFKQRDDTVRGTIEQKTNYILRYVAMMKKWHLNWAFKKDYLDNLKKECINSFSDLSEKIEESISLCSETKKNAEERMVYNLKEMKMIQSKLYKNFEMSNIFY